MNSLLKLLIPSAVKQSVNSISANTRNQPQLLVRMANYATRPQEDAGLVNGPQGLHPMNADIASFKTRNPMPTMIQAPRTFWQNTDLRQRNMVNPQIDQLGIDY